MIICLCRSCQRSFELKEDLNLGIVSCPFCGSSVVVGEQFTAASASVVRQKNAPGYAESESADIISLILGILSIVLWWIPILGFFLSLAGVCVSCIRKHVGGMIMSIIAIVLSFISACFLFLLLAVSQ